MTTELHAAAIVACTAIALAAVMVALAANRSGHHDRSTIDTDHARRLGLEVERHARRLAELEGRLARLQGTPMPHAGRSIVAPGPGGTGPSWAPTGGAHDAHRARHLDAGDTLRMPKGILAGGWR